MNWQRWLQSAMLIGSLITLCIVVYVASLKRAITEEETAFSYFCGYLDGVISGADGHKIMFVATDPNGNPCRKIRETVERRHKSKG